MVKSVTTPPLISVICCAHNEEEYIDKSIPNLLRALETFSSEVLFVADRCTDNTVKKVRKYEVKVIEKKWRRWQNSYAEALQTGYHNSKALFIGIVDADILVPTNFFRDLMQLVKGNVASVAAQVVTYPDTSLNRMIYAWERTRSVAPLGDKPRGAARIILKKALDEIQGFANAPTPDTDIDIRLAKKGYKSISTSAVRAFHIRHISLRTIVGGQITSGRGRYALGVSLIRTMGHAIFRFRPLVLYGWLLERQMSLHTNEHKMKIQ